MSDALAYLDAQHKRRRVMVAIVIVIVAIVAAVLYRMAPTPCTHFAEMACNVQASSGLVCMDWAKDPEKVLGPGITDEECRAGKEAIEEALTLPIHERKAAKQKIIDEIRARHPMTDELYPCILTARTACAVNGDGAIECKTWTGDPESYLGPGVTDEECRAANKAVEATTALGIEERWPATEKIIRALQAKHPITP